MLFITAGQICKHVFKKCTNIISKNNLLAFPLGLYYLIFNKNKISFNLKIKQQFCLMKECYKKTFIPKRLK